MDEDGLSDEQRGINGQGGGPDLIRTRTCASARVYAGSRDPQVTRAEATVQARQSERGGSAVCRLFPVCVCRAHVSCVVCACTPLPLT